jgi:hypothetical protein
MNTLPSLVGSAEMRYAKGTAEQRRAIPNRVITILSELKPSKAIVFSKEAWSKWPAFDGPVAEGMIQDQGTIEVWYGSYAHADGSGYSMAYQTRHPQGANKKEMENTVAMIMQHRPQVA